MGFINIEMKYIFGNIEVLFLFLGPKGVEYISGVIELFLCRIIFMFTCYKSDPC